MGFRDIEEQGTFHAGREYERKIQIKQIEKLETENKRLKRILMDIEDRATINFDEALLVFIRELKRRK